jgi:hypothetical protein
MILPEYFVLILFISLKFIYQLKLFAIEIVFYLYPFHILKNILRFISLPKLFKIRVQPTIFFRD